MNLSIVQVFAKCKLNTTILSFFSISPEKRFKKKQTFFGHIWAFYKSVFNLIMRYYEFYHL